MGLTKEEVTKLLSVILHQLAGSWQKEKIHSDVTEIIMNMRIKAENEQEYMDLLLANIAFAVESSRALQQIMELILKQKTLPSAQAIETMMKDAQTHINEQLGNLTGTYRAHFEKIEDEKERKRRLELTYCPVVLANRIKTDFILGFVHENNRETIKELLNTEPAYILESLHRLSGLYASMLLEGIDLP
ncbi:hypothetical protein B0I26_1059 [Anoxybacillus vitaminiphilus]|uniref:Uncharacterized protein n=1 Tax=Paranoxybacillus vitaminiphilus TaxID=581036 RepID=A0A327YFJ3_9BACL|nr:hypothetical protein [Anoxybacillus vitaminiphilus]RAK19828.1 hypothetical protein B0I26_1059 [Anoxybacillus vitaminiphilus]